MAAEGGKKTTNLEPEGAIDSILSYLKERIESPFLISFIFSWSICNRDFLFYFFLSADPYDHSLFVNWDFSLWLPLISSVVLTLFFSSVSSLLSGGRYYFLKLCISFAKEHKDGFDAVYAQNLEQRKLDKLKSECAVLEMNRSSLLAKVQSARVQLEQTSSLKLTKSLGELALFLRDAARFMTLYKSNHLNDFEKKSEAFISPNSIIKLSIVVRTEDKTEIESFEGLAFEFITNDKYFNWGNTDSVDTLSRLLKVLAIDNDVVCSLNKLGSVRCVLVESKVYNEISVD